MQQKSIALSEDLPFGWKLPALSGDEEFGKLYMLTEKFAAKQGKISLQMSCVRGLRYLSSLVVVAF